MFCGGSNCKYENYLNWINDPEHPNAIKGLFSNWFDINKDLQLKKIRINL